MVIQKFRKSGLGFYSIRAGLRQPSAPGNGILLPQGLGGISAGLKPWTAAAGGVGGSATG